MKKLLLAEGTLRPAELTNLATWIPSTNRLTMGPLTAEFEAAFATYMGGSHAVFVNSGSSANLLAMYALKETKPHLKTVIAPAISWATTVAPAIQLGMDVKLCDCDAVNLGLDLNHFEQLCKNCGPAIVILVHVLGHPNHMREILDLADKYGMVIIEDACEALGSAYRGTKVGRLGAAGTFSFYYGHQMSTIEGGVVLVGDRALWNVVRSMRAHGWARDIDEDVRCLWEDKFGIDAFSSLYTFYYPGFNCRPTDLNAFLGLSQLSLMDDVQQTRERNYDRYRAALESSFWVQKSEYDRLCSFAFGTIVKNRLEVFRNLQACGIESRPLICGSIGRQPFWTRRYGPTALEKADIVHEEGIYLPNHANLSLSDVDRIVHEFVKVAIPSSRLGAS